MDHREKVIFGADKDKKVYEVNNQGALKGHEGHHVRVIEPDNNGTLNVDKVEMLKSTGK